MDWLKSKDAVMEYLKKYRYVLAILLTGILLMLVPQQEPKVSAEQETVSENKDLQQALQETLSMIKGAGKVVVLLTEKMGAETIYQTDEDITGDGDSEKVQRKTILTTDSDREETGLVRQVRPPVLQGAVIVCQGGDDPKVKLAIVEAVTRATGLPASSIAVLKMK